jgi:hypothetical protein
MTTESIQKICFICNVFRLQIHQLDGDSNCHFCLKGSMVMAKCAGNLTVPIMLKSVRYNLK